MFDSHCQVSFLVLWSSTTGLGQVKLRFDNRLWRYEHAGVELGIDLKQYLISSLDEPPLLFSFFACIEFPLAYYLMHPCEVRETHIIPTAFCVTPRCADLVFSMAF